MRGMSRASFLWAALGGAVAVALVAGLGVALLRQQEDEGPHAHKCSACGMVWEHAGIPRTSRSFRHAHACPGCGAEQVEKHAGPAA